MANLWGHGDTVEHEVRAQAHGGTGEKDIRSWQDTGQGHECITVPQGCLRVPVGHLQDLWGYVRASFFWFPVSTHGFLWKLRVPQQDIRAHIGVLGYLKTTFATFGDAFGYIRATCGHWGPQGYVRIPQGCPKNF